MADGRIYSSATTGWDCDADDPQDLRSRAFTAARRHSFCPPTGDPAAFAILSMTWCCALLSRRRRGDRQISLLGGGDTVYMNTENLYLLRSRWTETVENSYTESVYTVREYLSSAETQICRIAFSGGALTFAGSGSVPGYLDDQFSVDEYGGYLRIVNETGTRSATERLLRREPRLPRIQVGRQHPHDLALRPRRRAADRRLRQGSRARRARLLRAL